MLSWRFIALPNNARSGTWTAPEINASPYCEENDTHLHFSSDVICFHLSLFLSFSLYLCDSLSCLSVAVPLLFSISLSLSHMLCTCGRYETKWNCGSWSLSKWIRWPLEMFSPLVMWPQWSIGIIIISSSSFHAKGFLAFFLNSILIFYSRKKKMFSFSFAWEILAPDTDFWAEAELRLFHRQSELDYGQWITLQAPLSSQ